jgi:NADPH-dependent 2,4-dienoyl-CoA reductase/sulfur reductase-like enzyme
VLIGDEPVPPYQRPPLSKAWLKGEADGESLALRPLDFYAPGSRSARNRWSSAAIGAPPEFMPGQQLIASGARVDRARLADPSASMKQVTF